MLDICLMISCKIDTLSVLTNQGSIYLLICRVTVLCHRLLCNVHFFFLIEYSSVIGSTNCSWTNIPIIKTFGQQLLGLTLRVNP